MDLPLSKLKNKFFGFDYAPKTKRLARVILYLNKKFYDI